MLDPLPLIRYPHSVPGETSIPAWAYMRLAPLSGAQFDVEQAQSVANQHQPDSTASGSYALQGPLLATNYGTAGVSYQTVSGPVTPPTSGPPTTQPASTHNSITTSQSDTFYSGTITPTATTADVSSAAPGSMNSPGTTSGSVHSTQFTLIPTSSLAVSNPTTPPFGSPVGPSAVASTARSHTGAIVAGVVAGIAAVVIAIVLALCITRRRRRAGERDIMRETHPFSWGTQHHPERRLPLDGIPNANKVVEPVRDPYVQHEMASSQTNAGSRISGARSWTDYSEASPPPYSVACAMQTTVGDLEGAAGGS
ncbi:hypothetical protein OH77DRAFT_754077 [Trametes cingulata]|nr:hypothetical protein OH77DRAFT_754077 [Trametes cingulata]